MNQFKSPMDMAKLAAKPNFLRDVLEALDGKAAVKAVKDICFKIGEFYLVEYGQEAREKIENIGFVKIEFGEAGKLNITVRRPGLFIGRRGENVDKLEKFLGRKVSISEALVDAENWIVWGAQPEPEYAWGDEDDRPYGNLHRDDIWN